LTDGVSYLEDISARCPYENGIVMFKTSIYEVGSKKRAIYVGGSHIRKWDFVEEGNLKPPF
jgi:hypothetical protein